LELCKDKEKGFLTLCNDHTARIRQDFVKCCSAIADEIGADWLIEQGVLTNIMALKDDKNYQFKAVIVDAAVAFAGKLSTRELLDLTIRFLSDKVANMRLEAVMALTDLIATSHIETAILTGLKSTLAGLASGDPDGDVQQAARVALQAVPG